MITFGNSFRTLIAADDLDDFLAGNCGPDVVECGENNDYWIRVVRSKKRVELVSKQTGATVMTASSADLGLLPLALVPAQISAIRAALAL